MHNTTYLLYIAVRPCVERNARAVGCKFSQSAYQNTKWIIQYISLWILCQGVNRTGTLILDSTSVKRQIYRDLVKNPWRLKTENLWLVLETLRLWGCELSLVVRKIYCFMEVCRLYQVSNAFKAHWHSTFYSFHINFSLVIRITDKIYTSSCGQPSEC